MPSLSSGDALSPERQRQLIAASRAAYLAALAGAVRHELAQPLSVIGNYAAVIRRSDGADATIRGMAAQIGTQVRTTGDILTQVRERVGRQIHANAGASALPERVATALAVHRGRGELLGVEIEVELAPDLPGLACDPLQLELVLMALVENALEAMAGIANPRLGISAAKVGAEVELCLSDNGHGIGAESAEAVFAAFYSTKKDGMGMGLAVCRHIVEGCAGRLWAESGGAGSCFYLRLPAALPETPIARRRAPTGAPSKG